MNQKIEMIRKKEINRFLMVSAVSIIATLLFFAVFARYEIMMFFMFGIFADVLIVSLMHQSAKKKYLQAYKELYLKEILAKEFDELKVDFEHGFSEEDIREGHLVALYDRFYSDDYLSGKFNGIPFECSDIHIQDVVRSGKSTTVVTRFQGLYLKVPLRKSFSGWLVVREREFLDNGNPRGWLSDMPHLERIEMEDESFNQKFSIYASDGTEAFYLLTPRFLEEMKRIELKFEGRCMFGFWNGVLHMAIDSRTDHFDISLFERADELKLSQHKQEIEMIKGMLECVRRECE